MYQNLLGPSGGIYHPNFVPCFVYHQLNSTFMRKLHLQSSYLSFKGNVLSLMYLGICTRLSARAAADDRRVIEAGGAGRRCKHSVSGLESLMNA